MLSVHPIAFDLIAPRAAEIVAEEIAEMRAAGISDEVMMLEDAVPECLWAEELRCDGAPIALFGVRPVPGRPRDGVPWMLTLRRMEQANRVAVARECHRQVGRMRERFDVLTNWVHCNNARSIRFIEAMGFHVEPSGMGPGGQFRRFWWRRDV